ncbi:hypothetical protein JTE90_013999 [Oedothorax gibbosus]|uniref:Uncharacterized protein n=1 Tax=Oedothorax gibbosus TaxID=931172 RepID=A0AAV6U413_9ARAC|nr:hypothetical protein JTE90_013999 [Oedothorax gibbosus]
MAIFLHSSPELQIPNSCMILAGSLGPQNHGWVLPAAKNMFFNWQSNEDEVSLQDFPAVIFAGYPQGYAFDGCLTVDDLCK